MGVGILLQMQESLLRRMRAQRTQIRSRWEALLRVEKLKTPLANPDTLVYLFDQTLDEIFAALRHPPSPIPAIPLARGCEKNPLVTYFAAGEQALLEALVHAQAEVKGLTPEHRDADFAELKQVMHTLAQKEISTLDEVCQPHSAKSK